MLRNQITKHAFPEHHIRVLAQDGLAPVGFVVLTREDYEKIKIEAYDLGWERRILPEETN